MMFSKFRSQLIYSGGSIALLLFCLNACQADKPVSEVVWTGYTMGTSYQIKIAQVEIEKALYQRMAKSIDSVLVEINRQMSTYQPQSEISVFNRTESTAPFPVSDGFMTVTREALHLYESSGGAFDATVAPLVNLWGFGPTGEATVIPEEKQIAALQKYVGSGKLEIVDSLHIRKTIPELQLDLSAIAKGYGVDMAAQWIGQKGFTNYMVEIGGEVMARGLNATKEPWKIGIDRPKYANLPGQDLQGILALKDVAVATSGDYRNYFEFQGQKYSHTIDPRTGKPVTHNLASVTIIAENCTKADGIATAVMVMGYEKGFDWLQQMPGVEGLLILRTDGEIFEEHQTPGYGKYMIGR